MDKDYVKKKIKEKEEECEEMGMDYSNNEKVADMKKEILNILRKSTKKSKE